jgi:hypothetical protein
VSGTGSAAELARGEPMVDVAVGPLTFSMTPATAEAVRGGELDPDVGYMQGLVKVTGDMAAFYDLLPLADSVAFRRVVGLDVGDVAP